jgi:hypothetical protein
VRTLHKVSGCGYCPVNNETLLRARALIDGAPRDGRIQRRPMSLLQSMRYEVSPTGCWVWSGLRKANGYGIVHVSRKTCGTPLRRHAHRVMYQLLVGEVPDGLTLDHLCRNRACVNPGHLEPVSNAENVLRGNSPPAVNARRQSCRRGHEYTAETTYVAPGSGKRSCRICDRDREKRRVRPSLRKGELLIVLQVKP